MRLVGRLSAAKILNFHDDLSSPEIITAGLDVEGVF